MAASDVEIASRYTRVVLSNGMSMGGSEPAREAALRAIEAEDALFALDTATALLPGERGTALLARCLAGGADLAAGLTAGDRETLLLHLRRLSLGEAIACVLQCPDPACGVPMDVELCCSDLLLEPVDGQAAPISMTAEVTGSSYDVTFRLPTSADLAAVGYLARQDAEAGAVDILQRCLLEATCEGQPVAVADLPVEVRSAIAAGMAAADPQAELELELRCPACGLAFGALFDTGSFFLRELEVHALNVLRDIHTLALHYHWSEADLLRMTPARRVHYLNLLAEAAP